METGVMDSFPGQCVRVVLSFQRGIGLNFIKRPIVFTCSLDGEVLETDAILVKNSTVFESSLVWEFDARKFKRLLEGNTVIKVDISTLETESDRKTVGHIVVSLSAAKPYKSNIEVPYVWHKLSGIKLKNKSVKPQILLRLTTDMVFKDKQDTHNKMDKIKDKHSISKSNSIERVSSPIDISVKHKRENVIQVGPDSQSTELFSLSFIISKMEHTNLLHPKESANLNNESSIEFSLFSKNITLECVPKQTYSTIIQSSISLLSRYFKKNPYMIIKHSVGQRDIGVFSLDIRKVIPTNNTSDFLIDFCDTSETYTHKERYILISCITNEIPSDSDGNKPYIEIEIKLKYLKKLKDADNKSVVSGDKSSVVAGNVPSSTGKTSVSNVNRIIDNLDVNEKFDVPKIDKRIKESIGFNEVPSIFERNGMNCSAESSTTSSERSAAVSKTIHKIYNYSTHTKHNISERSINVDENKMTLVINELEDWMEKRKEMFKFHLHDIEKQHLENLNREWNAKRTELERTLIYNIEYCQNLISTLNKMVENLNLAESNLEDRQRRFKFTQTELELDYKKKYQDLKNASKEMENNFQYQLKLHQIEYAKVNADLKFLTQENKSLRETLRTFNSLNKMPQGK